MIRRVRICGLGAHEETELLLEPRGIAEITGPSEAGKTLLADAICYALWGWGRHGRPLDLRAMRDGDEVLSVELELASGTVATRTLRRSASGGRGKLTRVLTDADGDHEHRTERAWLGALRAVGARPEALRQILVPMAWIPLAEGEGHGRPLRDLLDSLLPQESIADVVRSLLEGEGAEWREGDPVHLGDAIELRRRANASREQLTGDVLRLRQLVQAAEATPPRGPPQAEVAAARAVIPLARIWEDYDAALDAWEAAEQRAAQSALDAAEWNARLAGLGPEPMGGGDEGELAAAEERVRSERAALQSLEAERARLDADLERARSAVERCEGARGPSVEIVARVNAAKAAHSAAVVALRDASGGTCPTCHRPGWEGATEALARALEVARAEDEAAARAYEESAAEIAAEQERERRDARYALDRATAAATACADRPEAARRSLEAAEATLASLRSSAAPAAEWRRARAALGDRPAVLEGGTEPSAPASPRPSESQIREARSVIVESNRHEGARVQRERDLAATAAQLQASEIALADAELEATRLDALVAAVRAAPSESIRRQLGVFGQLGPVTLEMLDGGGVRVLVDGRPYRLASTGRLVVADVWLRAGLRRAARAPWMPLIVDQVQDVGGQSIPAVAPAIWLRTTGSGPLRVVGGS